MRTRPVRSSRRRSRLRLRLTLGFAGALAAVLAAVAAFVYSRTASDLLTVNDAGLRSRAEVIVTDFRNRGAVELDVGSSLIETDEAFAQVVDPSGRIVESSPKVSTALIVSPALLRAHSEPRFVDSRVPGIDNFARVLVVPITTLRGHFFVLVGSSLQDRADQLGDLTKSLAIGLPTALLSATILAGVLVGAALRPVERMRRDADAIAGSNLTSRISTRHVDDELERLAETLNEMLDRIAAAFDTERSFIDNASHELRTPLAIMRTELDLALAAPRTAEELAASIQSTSDEVQHLTRLAENLLATSRARNRPPGVDVAPVQLRDMIDDLARRHRHVAGATHLSTAPDTSADWVHIDTVSVREALDNLVHNAIRHTPPGGQIRLQAAHDQGIATFTVIDNGPGFRDDILPRAFEPFVSTHDTADSTGLGLAMARFIARAHGGDASAANDPAGGARVTLWIRTIE
jgi:two-component system, OmpR family, sensor kinase